jgi:hypothetical protein
MFDTFYDKRRRQFGAFPPTDAAVQDIGPVPSCGTFAAAPRPVLPPREAQLRPSLQVPADVPDDIGRRLGRFRIVAYLFYQSPRIVLAVLSGCIVVRCELRCDVRAVEYTACHRDFDFVAEGETVPFYLATLTRMLDEAGNETVAVSWSRR